MSAPGLRPLRRSPLARAALTSVLVTALAAGCATTESTPPADEVWHGGASLGLRVPSGASAAQPERWDEDAFALSERADRAYREARWIDAARHYGALTERVPSDAYAWFRLGNTWAQQGAFDRATHAYEQSLERDAHQPKPWFNLSTAYLLNAQRAMNRAWAAMRPGDPARAMIERRLAALGELMHDRIEDAP